MGPTRAVLMDHVPQHLLEHIAKQDYTQYSAIDHASWRYIMRVSKAFFKTHAHEKYMMGLEKTGITIDRIPRIDEMDEKLKKIGWRAVTVSGFIPPSVFLEFQSLSILPIACDMRRLEHLEYTPSPDIVHEAAGHAPIIADAAFAAYLHNSAEIARKAIFSKEDLEVYEAIKHLSDIKEIPTTTEDEVKAAYKRLDSAYEKVHYVSEAAQLARLAWWTTEYGLVREGNSYKIYGAGLLSSVSESYNAIHSNVKKVPLTIDCINVNYDITKPQPQLFYVDHFAQLDEVLEQLADTMAYRTGGPEALEKALRAGTVTTTVLDSGLQISGVLANVHKDAHGQPVYLQYSGPVQLAQNDQEITGHSAEYHKLGFGTPIGRIKDFEKIKFAPGQKCKVVFESGVEVVGEWVGANENLILSFKNCTVTYKGQILFSPDWGLFDMACGDKVVSVFGGAADRSAYQKSMKLPKPEFKKQVSHLVNKDVDLNRQYQIVRDIREAAAASVDGSVRTTGWPKETLDQMNKVSIWLDEKAPQDWLLRLELYELVAKAPAPGPAQAEAEAEAPQVATLKSRLIEQLNQLAKKSDEQKKLIERGLELAKI